MSTFITRCPTSGDGVRLAVKDLIDMEGEVTTAGCRAVAERAVPATRDAVCLAGARAAGARLVGRTNLHELALGVTGINPWFGTPVNPLDPGLVPGGSSSGSAVAVADGEADVAYGSDTGGSIRIPAACCGVSGLKTTWGRVPLGGVWPLSPSFDTVGPMARDVAGLVLGMQLLEPGFTAAPSADITVGRLDVPADPRITAAVEDALGLAGWPCTTLSPADLPGWDEATRQAGLLLVAEAWQSDQELVRRHPEAIGDDVRARLLSGADFDEVAVAAAWEGRRAWQAALAAVFARVDVLVTPTLAIFPPTLDNGQELLVSRFTMPANLAGIPALALPVPVPGPGPGPGPVGGLPASIQLMGRAGSEELLLAAGAWLEGAVAAG